LKEKEIQMGFKKATKEKAKLRCAMFGPSGAGKTFTALSMATGLGSSIAVIDSERGSASKYADRFEFDVIDLEKKTIDEYVKWIEEAKGYDVLVIDSLSHAWQELLEEIDRIAKAKFSGNTWAAWNEGTPKHRKLVDAILSFDGHVIATMRSKTEWQITENDKGKKTPQRVGLAPEQGKGIEYEFDFLMEINQDHIGTVIKDRSGKFQDSMYDKPGKKLGEELKAWLSDGADPNERQALEQFAKVKTWLSTKNPSIEALKEAKDKWVKFDKLFESTGKHEQYDEIMKALDERILELTQKEGIQK
jgi:hypothetical protein